MSVSYNNSYKLPIITVILFLTTVGGFAQDKKGKLNEEKNKLKKEIEYTNKLLSETKKNTKASLNQLNILNSKIEKRNEMISTVSGELNYINEKISSTNDTINKLKQDIIKLKEEYAKLIYYAYKNKNSYNYVMFILSSKDFNQAYKRLKYIQQYNDYRRKQAELIIQHNLLLTKKIAELASQKSTKLSLLGGYEGEKKLIQSEQKEKSSIVQNLQKREKELVKTLKEKEASEKKLQKAIEALIAEEIKKAEMEKNATHKTTTTNYMMTPEEVELSNNFAGNKGKLPWPSEKGIISSTFGEHPHPDLPKCIIKNNGIDIATTQGSKARAVFNGKVTGIISIPGTGKAVIIRHGDYLSVYSNLDEVYVKKGQVITTKQEIGLISTDTNKAKTELHFEIWQGKTLLNPADWIAKGKNITE